MNWIIVYEDESGEIFREIETNDHLSEMVRNVEMREGINMTWLSITLASE